MNNKDQLVDLVDSVNENDWSRLYIELRLKSFEATINYAVLVLKSLFLMNGGAILALISFAGANKEVNSEALSNGMLLYAVGLVFVVVATGYAYFA